ncbi:hypothetical protein [Rhizobium sp. AAP43]|uniref:hypothetical protein n=1 Tax=Rhizobium sp. AAP43 TaxID=1523420 RepID=UPI0006B93DBE|nr:hypothetical protein [Rhizobium sp. AAP43]
MDQKDSPHLGPDERDRSVAILRSVSGSVPVLGPFLSEIITNVIPNQRMDRLERFLRLLDERLEGLEEGQKTAINGKPEAVALLEDGAMLAARAVSPERLGHIVSLVSSGLKDEDRNLLKWRRTLGILEQLDDLEVAILYAYRDPILSFRELETLRPQALTYIGSDATGHEEEASWKASLNKLERLSLLSFSQKTEKGLGRTHFPIYDAFGRPEGSHSLSTFGRAFLRAIGLNVSDPR